MEEILSGAEKKEKERPPALPAAGGRQGRQGKVCAVCGKPLGYRRKKYCSDVCAEKGEIQSTGERKKCVICGKPVGYRRRRYCSFVCAAKGKIQSAGERKKCVICGKPVGHRRRRYCSDSCAAKGEIQSAGERKKCVICGKPVGYGRRSYCCEECAKAGQKKNNSEWQKVKKEDGHSCRSCGTVLYSRKQYCDKCRQERRRRAHLRANFRKIGVCDICKRASKSRICPECESRQNKLEQAISALQRLTAPRSCPACGKESLFFDEKEGLCCDCALRKLRSREPQAGKTVTESVCWYCKNAVPKVAGGRYIAGCPWSVKHKPIAGWEAEMRHLSGNKRESYLVRACPGFVKG